MAGWQTLRGAPLMIVIGELLLVVCSACYLSWWTITFRPSARTPTGGGGPFLVGAMLGGVGGLALLAIGIVGLLPKASGGTLGATIIGGAVVGALLLVLTSQVAHRQITTELPLIIVWGTAQLAAGLTLWTSGVLRTPSVVGWVVAIAVATLVALGCYLVFYRLDPVPGYWVGMVPLALDGVVALVLAALLALTRVPSPRT